MDVLLDPNLPVAASQRVFNRHSLDTLSELLATAPAPVSVHRGGGPQKRGWGTGGVCEHVQHRRCSPYSLTRWLASKLACVWAGGQQQLQRSLRGLCCPTRPPLLASDDRHPRCRAPPPPPPCLQLASPVTAPSRTLQAMCSMGAPGSSPLPGRRVAHPRVRHSMDNGGAAARLQAHHRNLSSVGSQR